LNDNLYQITMLQSPISVLNADKGNVTLLMFQVMACLLVPCLFAGLFRHDARENQGELVK